MHAPGLDVHATTAAKENLEASAHLAAERSTEHSLLCRNEIGLVNHGEVPWVWSTVQSGKVDKCSLDPLLRLVDQADYPGRVLGGNEQNSLDKVDGDSSKQQQQYTDHLFVVE